MQANTKKQVLLSALCTAILIIAGLLYGFWVTKPTKISANQEKQAHYTQTMQHLKQIAKEPHSSGSGAIEEVKRYLTDEFERMNLSYERIDFTLMGIGYTDFLVHIDAPNTDEAVMFVSHFDSVNTGPGAADDGVSVASMLTTIEEVIGRQEYKNDLYFLFTDGEELGLLGAGYFVGAYDDTYPDKVKLVVNLEARGNTGTVLMFETSEDDYEMARMLKKAVKSGSTPFSFASALYKVMPNDTDLTCFLEKGYTGMNFAVVEGVEHYHQKTDDIAHLNEDTAFMYYATTSELADYLEEYDLTRLSDSGDGVYFPVAKGRFALFHKEFINAFAVITMLAFVAVIVLLYLKNKCMRKANLLTPGVFLATIILGCGLAWLIYAIEKWRFGTVTDLITAAGAKGEYLTILTGAILLLVLTVMIVFRKKIGSLTDNLIFYGEVFLLCSLLIFIFFPAAVYLFVLPLFAITVILGMQMLTDNRLTKMARGIASLFLCMIIIIIYVPTLSIVYHAILIGMDTPVMGMIMVVVEVLLSYLCMHALLNCNLMISGENK